MWCEENNLTPLKRRSFSESVIANQNKYNLEYCNKITNAAGRRVCGFSVLRQLPDPISTGFPMFQSVRTYRMTGDDFSATVLCTYVRSVLPQTTLYRKNADRQNLYLEGVNQDK